MQGKGFKTDAWRELLARFSVSEQECAYMGDDVPDIPVLMHAGLACAPADANPDIEPLLHWKAPAPGGNGAVRAMAELILKAQGRWDALVRDKYVREPWPAAAP